MNYFSNHFENNVNFISEVFENNINLINDLINIEMDLFEMIQWTLHKNLQAIDMTTSINLSGFLKSMLSIYSAYDLNLKGQYGSSRVLLRHAFEYLIISKYCSVSKDHTLIETWESGDDVWLGNDVFRKILNPSIERFKRLWKVLCQFSHATVYSQQIAIKEFPNIEDVKFNFALIRALLEMNYHLLNRHLVNNSMMFYFNSYSTAESIEAYRTNKVKIKNLFTKSKKIMSQETKGIIRDYVSKWTVK